MKEVKNFFFFFVFTVFIDDIDVYVIAVYSKGFDELQAFINFHLSFHI